MLFARTNDALNINKPPAEVNLTTQGSDWLWAVTALDFFFFICLLVWTYVTPRSDRVFHYLAVLITIVTAIDYYTMASDLGSAALPVEFHRHKHTVTGATREVFWIRYVDWFLTHPMIIIQLLLTAGVYWHTILFSIILELVWVIMFLIGAIVPDTYKWGFYVIGVVALFVVLESIIFTGMVAASRVGGSVANLYRTVAPCLTLFWLLYTVCWPLSEGGNVISVDGEMVFYGVLDLLCKPILSTILLLGHTRIDKDVLNLHWYDRTTPAAVEKPSAGNGGAAAV